MWNVGVHGDWKYCRCSSQSEGRHGSHQEYGQFSRYVTLSSFFNAEFLTNCYVCTLIGRSNYIDEESMRGTPDPGAYAVMAAFETAAKEMK